MNAPAPTELPLSPHPVVAFTGPFGTGKTEVAVSYALAALAQGRGTLIVDLDVVTPYHRVGDYRGQLANKGLQVIAAAGALASFELPSVSPKIAAALRSEDNHVVLDGGGDPVGARLLAVYATEIAARGYDMWLAVNPFRPSASSPQAVAEQARAIETASRLRLTGVAANPHLGPLTEPAHIRTGLEEVRRSADRIGLPVVFLAAEASLLDDVRSLAVPVLPVRRLLRQPWERE
ncbi:MAG: hypothetical protein JSV79_14100 [Armatimonadota bacterium]|nr:MAG: hypothetical protein JSV79_14100 [Armatimonadota bacterium]